MYVSNYYFNDGDYRDSFGFLFKPDDRPPVSLESSLGFHYFGDTSELAYLSKLEDPYTNKSFRQSYPPLLILLFKNFINSSVSKYSLGWSSKTFKSNGLVSFIIRLIIIYFFSCNLQSGPELFCVFADCKLFC